MENLHETRLIALTCAVFFGVSLSVLAKMLRVPAIVPLLIGGVILGPEVLGVVQTAALGSGLQLIVSLSVAIILFEGGLTLDPAGFKSGQKVVGRLLSVGVVVTWFVTAALVHLLFGFDATFSMLAASLIIVTGPTVISPLLSRVRVKERVHQILHWEGVLIDPIGVFIAIMCFEWFTSQGSLVAPIGQFSLRVVVGIGVGALGGIVINRMLRNGWIDDDQVNISVFGGALMLFTLAELAVHEAGILAVVAAGSTLGWLNPDQLKRIKAFKSELTEIAVGILFILLAANLKLSSFVSLGWNGVLLICAVLFIVRPLSIALCTIGSEISLRERAFLAWTAPRGVVAGSMASLFAIELTELGTPGASFLEAFTFSIIAVTVIVQGLLTGVVAGVLGIKAPPRSRWLIVGAHQFGRSLAGFINKHTDNHAILVDSNADAVANAKIAGLDVVQGNALNPSTLPAVYLNTVGNVVVLTDNQSLNQLICSRWTDTVGQEHLFHWSPDERHTERDKVVGRSIWSKLPKPSKVAYDLRNKDAELISNRLTADTLQSLRGSIPLIAGVEGGGFQVADFDWQGEAESLIYERSGVYLPFYVQRDFVFDIDEGSFEHVVDTALDSVTALHSEVDVDEARRSLLNTEMQYATVLKNGVAVPHARCADLPEPICAIARVRNGISLGNQNAEPTTLFFILLSPARDPETHLGLLGSIARISADRALVGRLCDADDAHAVVDVLRRHAELQ